jgi:hypothetical protein
LLVSLSAGFAASAPQHEGGQTSLPLDYESKLQAGEGGEGRRPARDPEPLAGGEPYAERPGSDSRDEDDAPPRVVTFVPPGKPRPVPRGRRPRLPERVSLALVLVREGTLTHDASALLELDGHLRDDMQVRSLVALGTPTKPRAGLEDLAEVARKQGRDLVLVDVRPGVGGALRTGYLVSAKGGELLAWYEQHEEGVIPASTAGDDLAERLGRALAKLK